MNKEKRHIGWLMSSMLMLLLTACSSDSAKGPNQQEELEDLNIELRAVTRTGLAEDEYDSEKKNIHVFLKASDDPQIVQGMFKYHQEEDLHYWTAQDLKVKPGTREFSLFGYMPASEGLTGTIDTENCKLTLTGINPMTTSDICVVTGVNKSEVVSQPLRGSYTFDYINSTYNERTILNLRLEHLLGRLVFKFKVGMKYSALRKIKIKSLKIETEVPASITATVYLPMLTDDVIKVEYTGEGDNMTWSSNLLTEADPSVWLSTTAEQVGHYINVAVGGGLSDQYKLVSTYEVYDLQDHFLSERTSANKLNKVMPVKSQVKEVVLTIEPTYLYQLGDDDLNNPEVTIQ